MSKFIRAADSLIELVADFNDINPSSHTEDTLEIHAEEIIELWGKVKLMYSRFMNEESGLKRRDLSRKKPSKKLY